MFTTLLHIYGISNGNVDLHSAYTWNELIEPDGVLATAEPGSISSRIVVKGEWPEQHVS